MAHLVRDEPWGVVDVDLEAGSVFVREDWRYDWKVDPGQPPWSTEEKTAFHHGVDRLIWAAWSLKARLFPFVSPGHTPSARAEELVRRFARHGFQLSFDVRRIATGTTHWTATVTKVDPNEHPRQRARVWFDLRLIRLHSIDVIPVEARRYLGDSKSRSDFRVAPHEFGHTLRYADDYDPGRYFNDTRSIMNIGRDVRPRHLTLVLNTLEKMIPGCKFSAVMQ